MSKHTQARLTYRPHWSGMGGFELCFDPKGVAMAETPNWGTDEIEADTRRLVACWNACEGYETETLETVNLIESAYAAEGREFELTRQRDELLQALTRIRALPVHADAIRMAHKHAEDAIAKVTAEKA